MCGHYRNTDLTMTRTHKAEDKCRFPGVWAGKYVVILTEYTHAETICTLFHHSFNCGVELQYIRTCVGRIYTFPAEVICYDMDWVKSVLRANEA